MKEFLVSQNFLQSPTKSEGSTQLKKKQTNSTKLLQKTCHIASQLTKANMQTNYQPTENYSFFEYENQIGNTLPQFQTNLESVYTVNGSWNSQSSIFQTLEEDSEFPSLFSQSTDDLPLLDTNFDGSLAQAYDNTPLSLETPFADDFFETDSIFEDDDDDYSSGSSTTSSSSVSTIASPTNMSAGLLNPFAPETYETKNHVIDILSFLNWNPNFMLQNATFQALKPSQEQQSMCSQIVVKMEEKPFLISVVPLTNDNQPQEFVKAEPTAPVAIKKENGKCARKVKKEEKEGTHKIKKPKVAQKTVAALKKEVTLEVAASGCNPLKEEVEITSQNGFFTMVRGVTSPNAEKVIGGKGFYRIISLFFWSI